MNINKINDILEFWHNKYEKPSLTKNYNNTNINKDKKKYAMLRDILIFPSTYKLLINYFKNDLKNLKNYYFISYYYISDNYNMVIIGIYDLDNNKLIDLDKDKNKIFNFNEIITDKWMDLNSFLQFLDRYNL